VAGGAEMSRKEYIDWHISQYGYPPKPYLLEKYFPKDNDVNEKDWEEFWKGVEPEKRAT
jgi:hypothetical protein